MKTAKTQPKEQPASQQGEASTASALATVLAYVAERNAAADANENAAEAMTTVLSSLMQRLAALETRNLELETKVVSLRKLSESLQDALREAQLGFRRHIRQRVTVSDLQAALAFPQATDAAAPQAGTSAEGTSCASEPSSSDQEISSQAGEQVAEGQPAQPASQSQPTSDRPPPKRNAHGRSKVGVIPQVFVEILPPEVQLEGLNHFKRIGQEDSPVLGYRRGGPVQIVFRRIKFVAKGNGGSAAVPEAHGDGAAATYGDDNARPATVNAQAPVSSGAPDGEVGRVERAPADSPPARVKSVTVTASEVLGIPADPAFKQSPFVDGAFVWYTPKADEAEPARQVLIASLPEKPLVRGMADASLIAHLVSHKLDFHLPYYRQQSELSRYGLPISRANLCRWHFEAGALVEPIAKAMWEEALGRRWFAMDATSTAIFNKGKYRKGHIYVLVAPGDGVVFRYEPKYDGATVAKLFGGTDAVVVADACATNNPAFGPGKVRGSGCWSHARKRFVSAFELGDKRGAAPGLQFIRELFRIEDETALLSAEDRLRIRQERSAPVIAAFYEYIAAFPELDSDAPMYEAVVYVTNQKEMLCRFLSNGEVPIHNNASERALRRIVKGRANWLFMFSDEHAKHSCALVSLLASCEPHGLDPEFYLQEVLTVAPTWPRSRALELSPKYWLQTRQQLIRDGVLRYIDLGRISGSSLAFRPS